MKKAVIYSRVSTQEQSFQSQIDDLQKYAQYANLQIVDIFAEKVSGYNLLADRSEYDRMKEFVVANSIDLICCWELSRFGRNSLHTLNEIDFYTKKNIDIYFKKENIYTLSNDPISKLVLSLLSGIAEMERQTIVSRTSRGKESAAQKGKRIGFAIMPYGFDSDNGYIAINEDEAKHVRMMYDMASNGISLRAIVNKLNSLNIPTKKATMGKKKTVRSGETVDIQWRTNTVRKILTSTLYKGERNFKGGILVQIPQIVSEEIWNKTQAIFSNHIGYTNTTKYDYLFKGKMYCGNCGYIIGTRTEKRYAHLPSYYFCTARREPNVNCKAGQFDSKVFDELIYTQLFKNDSVVERFHEESKKDFNLQEKQSQIAYFRGEIVRSEALKKRVNNLYLNELISDSEVKQQHQMIRNATLENENNIAKIEKEIQNYTDWDVDYNLFKMTVESNFDIKHEFISKFVDKIKLYKVDNNGIDFTKLYTGGLDDMHIGKYSFDGGMKQMKNPHGNDKIAYVEIFAFGNPKPLKVTLTNVTKQCFISENLIYERGQLTLKQ